MKIPKKALHDNLDLIAAFVLPILIFAGTMALLGVYPFGSRSINNLDLYHQYLPIMSELQRKIHSGESIFYSFNAGLGTDFYSLSTYQNASPITWIFLALFKEEHIVLCAVCMILFKIGLISTSMYYYLREVAGRDSLRASDRSVKIMLAAMFSLSGYILGYYTNPMWLDSIILTPLCILGLRKAVDKKGDRLYVIATALLLFTNYYIGAMVCIFIALYYIAYFVSERKANFAGTSIHIAALSAVSALMSMVILLPTYIALKKTADFGSIGSGFGRFMYHGIAEHIRQLLPCSSVTILEGPPNLYLGLVSLIFIILFAMRKDIDIRKRLVRVVFVIFVFISTNLAPLDLIWHFMHSPNSFPARYSFLLAFLMIETASEMLDGGRAFKTREIIAAFAGIAALYAISIFAKGVSDTDRRFMFITGAVLMLLYAFTMLAMRKEDGAIRRELLAVIIFFEIITSTFRGIGAGNIVKDNDYASHYDDVRQLIEIAEERDPYCRMELIGSDNDNPPYVYGYKGTSVFASSVPWSTYKLLSEKFPGGISKLNFFTFNEINPKSDSLLNIKYYISAEGSLDVPELREITSIGDCYLYENPYDGAFAYMTSEDGAEIRDKMKVTKMRGNKIQGSIDAEEEGILLITVPCDKGWRISLDGVPAGDDEEIEGFVSFRLGRGSHEIYMRFIPEGFIPGALLSLAGIIAFFLITCRQSIHTKA